MKELMVHVERIVRPIVASEALKLRMRRELLAHLVAALQQERAQTSDEAAAVERAVRRLGDPDELRQQLQASVPRLHRLMLARVPLLGALERRGSRFHYAPAAPPGSLDPFEAGPISHFALLIVPTCLAPIAIAVPVVLALVRRVPTWPAPAAPHVRLLILISVLSVCLSTTPCMWFCKAVATVGKPVQLGSAARAAVGVVFLLTAWVWCLAAALGGRVPVGRYLAESFAGAVSLIVILAVCTRLFSRLRRPYVEWLTLDIVTPAVAGDDS